MADDFFTKMVQKLFPERKTSSANVPLVNEPLTRNAVFQKEMRAWCSSARFGEVMDILIQQHELARLRGAANPAFQIYLSPQSNGFYFNEATGFEKQEFQYLLDHFREVTTAEGYRLQLAERRLSERENGVHCLERYYLKPDIFQSFQPPIDQKYGNVHLELVLMNERPSFLKVMAHVYSDRNYKEALPFESFAERLFSAPTGGLS